MTRKKLGEQVRIPTTCKVEPDTKEVINTIYGGFSNFINIKVKRDKKLQKALKELRKNG